MRGRFVHLVAVAAALSLAITACTTQAAPQPTQAPSAPATKAAEPTKAPAAQPTAPPAAQPTAAPAKTVAYPEKGKAISNIVSWAAGGATDINARLVSAELERELGTPVQVVNKVGAGGQVGLTEIALAKGDGYTIGYTNVPAVITIYLDPERKAQFNRKSFTPIFNSAADPVLAVVKADSPFKSVKDLVDAAKAKPMDIKAAGAGLMSSLHLGALEAQLGTGAKFTVVHFDGGAPGLTALLGGHVDVAFDSVGGIFKQVQQGTVRVLGVEDSQRSKFLPDAPTFEEQGYKVKVIQYTPVSAPAATPKEVVDILAAAAKKALQSDTLQKKLADMGLEPRYLGPAELATFWDQMETQTLPLLEAAKNEGK